MAQNLVRLSRDFSVADHQWQTATERPPLGDDEVHVWRSGPVAQHDQAAVLALLSDDERRRAAGYRFDRERTHFVVRRALLRRILALYAGCHPRTLRFLEEERGKPVLDGRQLPARVQFSMTSSHGFALFAIAAERPVGLDVERITHHKWCLDLADRFFAPQEAAELRALPSAEQPAAFSQYWTRKEAFLKGMGVGLLRPLDSFVVSEEPVNGRVRVRDLTSETAVTQWSIGDLRPAPDYVGAIAAPGDDWVCSCWDATPLM